MYNPKPSSSKKLSTSIEMSGEMSLHDRSAHSRFNDNASVEVSLHERSTLRSTHSRRNNPEMSQRSSHRSIHSSRRSSRELSMEDRSVDSRHSRVRDQVQEELSVAERSFDSRHSRLRDQVQEELSVAERSYQSKHSRHSSVYHDDYHDEEMPLFDPLLAHSSRQKKNGVPAILTVPKPVSSLHYEPMEAASLPDKMPHHPKRLSFNSQDGTHAMSMPDRTSSHNNGFAGGLALNHPSAMKGHGWEPSHAVKPKTTIKNSKKIRNKLFPSLLETSSVSDKSSLDGRPPRPNSDKSLGFSQVSYFYGNGVIVSGGPPNEIFLDEFGNKCAQYVNRTVVINDHQASHAASKGKEDDESTQKKAFFTGDSFRYRAILFFFMASTVLLLLMIVLGVGRKKPLVIRDSPTGDDIFFDDDDDYSMDDDAVVPVAKPRSGIILP